MRAGTVPVSSNIGYYMMNIGQTQVGTGLYRFGLSDESVRVRVVLQGVKKNGKGGGVLGKQIIGLMLRFASDSPVTD